MPGIYGIFGDTTNFDLMHQTMLYDSTYKAKYLKINDTTILGTSYYNNESFDLLENEELVIGFDGYFYTSESRALTDVNKIYDLYKTYGKDFINKLDGVFNIFIYNKKENKLNIFNDWAGNYFLFYYWDGKNFIFSSEMKSIIKIIKTKTLDMKGIKQQFMFNHLLFDNTLINEIKVLDAASIIEIKDQKIKIDNYYNIINDIQITNCDNVNTAVDQLYALFENATQKFMHIENMSLPMTGGMDSRLLLHFMLKYEYNFKDIFTFCTEKDEDVKIAKLICDHFGLKHRTFLRTYEDMHDTFEESYEYHDGILSSILNHLGKQKSILENGCYSMIQYFYNDIIFGERFAYKNRFLKKGKNDSETISKITKLFITTDVSDVEPLFKDDISMQSILEDVDTFLKDAKNLPSYSIFDYFSWYQHCRRIINVGSSAARSTRYIRRIVPSQDRNIILFAFSLPYKFRQWRFLLRKTIEKKCPELVVFPREGTGLPLNKNNSMQIMGRAYRKYIKKDVFAPNLSHMFLHFYTQEVNEKIEQLLFSKDNRTDEIINANSKKQVWGNIKAGKNQAGILHNIINLEIFLRKHF
jgi:asparagine synthase (glutamine-hydrolysing)